MTPVRPIPRRPIPHETLTMPFGTVRGGGRRSSFTDIEEVPTVHDDELRQLFTERAKLQARLRQLDERIRSVLITRYPGAMQDRSGPPAR